MNAFLGIDTSNYTTSAAIYLQKSGEILKLKKPLPVREGSLGLRQSDAVFAHVKALGGVLEELFSGFEGELDAVGVSTVPESVAGSYMPCFLAGEMAARSIAASHGIPLHTFSHQSGHIAAALYSTGRTGHFSKSFLAFHVSGGTTQGLIVKPKNPGVFDISCICKALDLYAGQLIDRVGAMLGLPFPAGPSLEKFALESGKTYNPKPAVRGADICLSGVENQCRDMLSRGESRADTARYCFDYVAAALCAMISPAVRENPGLPLVFAGGVMSNGIIRGTIEEHFCGFDICFAPPEFSADNAAGTAFLTYMESAAGF